jgi:hypothetical protein
MPLSKLKFEPGIDRDTTDYTNTGGWFDCDKVRFRNGLPEKIGGWQKFLPNQFLGSCREIIRWASLNGTIYTSIATNLKVYINGGVLGGLQDVTPIRETATLTNPFTTTSGSKTVIVIDAGHGCSSGDYVTFSGSGDVGGIPAADLNKEQIVVSVLGSSQYTILVATTASSTATGGGTVTAAYQVGVGLNSQVQGTGWGAGPFGGAAAPFSTTTLGSNPIATSTASNTSSPYPATTLTITHNSHGLETDDTVYLTGAATVGGVDVKFINRAFNITKTSANAYTVSAWTNATSSTSGGGAAVVVQAYKSTTSASVGTSTGWGVAADESSLSLQIRLWSLENYGENLLMNPSNGGIYYWIENTPTVRAVNLSTLPNASYVPQLATKVLVSDIGKHVIAFGASPFNDLNGQDKMLIRFSSDERPEYWNETDTTENAGSIRLSNGSFIVTAEQTRQEILVWTDSTLYSLQYQGAPYIFVATILSSGTDIIGPNAVATAANTSFWMGSDNFYYYDGNLNRMPCPVREKVFPNLNFEQRYKVFASVNSQLNEIIWLYPSVALSDQGNMNTENDSYVIYNYAEKIWYYGTLNRTAWADRGFGSNPLATSDDGYIYSHEVGSNDGSTNPPSPIDAYITSSPVEIEDGQNFAFVSRIIPDISFRQTQDQNPAATVDFTIYPQNYPGGMPPLNSDGVPINYYGTGDENPVTYNYSVGTFTQQLFTRIRGRSVILKVRSTDLGVSWRLGTPRLDIRTDGRR